MSNTGHKSCPINFKPEAMWKARSRPNSMIIILKTRQWERAIDRKRKILLILKKSFRYTADTCM
jgi:hypothetical protein